jgi:pyrroline-5-carboxylate reductase
VFLLAEVLEQAALDQELPAKLARRTARHTVVGPGALLGASEEDAAQHRINVTGSRGTTEPALAVLIARDAWPELMRYVIAAAA